ncbi:MAG: PKD domain-containing protein [Planctomycetota bacterium]
MTTTSRARHRARGALRALVVLPLAAAAVAQSVTIPAAAATVDGNTSSSFPFDTTNMRALHVYDSTHFTDRGVVGPILIHGLRVRANQSASSTSTSSWSGGTSTLELRISTAAVDHASPSATFALNHGADVTTAFQGSLLVAPGSTRAGEPGPFHVDIPFTTPFSYDPGSGSDLAIDYISQGIVPVNYPTLDAVWINHQPRASRVTSGSPTATTGTVQTDIALVVEVLFTSGGGPLAWFTAEPVGSGSPTVRFRDLSSTTDPGGILAWSWDVDGDGTTDYTEPEPVHTYTSGGSRAVRLTITDASGQAVCTRTVESCPCADTFAHGEPGILGDGLPARLRVGDPVLGTSLDLHWNAAPQSPFSLVGLGGASGALAFQNVQLWIDQLYDTFFVANQPAGTADLSIPLPLDPAFLGVAVYWQAFPFDASLAPQPWGFSDAVGVVFGDRIASEGGELEIEEEDPATARACGNGETRVRVFGWWRRTKGQGVQSVEVLYNGGTIADGTLAPGCIRGKIYTDVFRGCLPRQGLANRIALRHTDCNEPPQAVPIPAALLQPLTPPQRVVPGAGGNLPVAPNGRWAARHPNIVSVTPAGAWTANAIGVGELVHRATAQTEHGPIEVAVVVRFTVTNNP